MGPDGIFLTENLIHLCHTLKNKTKNRRKNLEKCLLTFSLVTYSFSQRGNLLHSITREVAVARLIKLKDGQQYYTLHSEISP